MPWIRLDKNGVFSNPHTGQPLELPPKGGVILRAIRGHAGDDPLKGHFIHVGDGKWIAITPDTKNLEAVPLLKTEDLFTAGRAVVNNGYAFFSDEAGSLDLDYPTHT
jgi:hypothetical protein